MKPNRRFLGFKAKPKRERDADPLDALFAARIKKKAAVKRFRPITPNW